LNLSNGTVLAGKNGRLGGRDPLKWFSPVNRVCLESYANEMQTETSLRFLWKSPSSTLLEPFYDLFELDFKIKLFPLLILGKKTISLFSF
jgi:hypothetical protein